jgi:hypothetical protein
LLVFSFLYPLAQLSFPTHRIRSLRQTSLSRIRTKPLITALETSPTPVVQEPQTSGSLTHALARTDVRSSTSRDALSRLARLLGKTAARDEPFSADDSLTSLRAARDAHTV